MLHFYVQLNKITVAQLLADLASAMMYHLRSHSNQGGSQPLSKALWVLTVRSRLGFYVRLPLPSLGVRGTLAQQEPGKRECQIEEGKERGREVGCFLSSGSMPVFQFTHSQQNTHNKNIHTLIHTLRKLTIFYYVWPQIGPWSASQFQCS